MNVNYGWNERPLISETRIDEPHIDLQGIMSIALTCSFTSKELLTDPSMQYEKFW